MTRQELIDQNSYLKAELHALTEPHIARMRAFDGWSDMEAKVAGQDDSTRKEWWLKQLNKIKPLFVQFDVMNGEVRRLEISLAQRGDQVNACLQRIKELEKEIRNLREML